MSTYKDLRVYQQSYRLALEIHTFSLTVPKLYQYDIADQIRRASRSIPSNIAEGYARGQSPLDTQRFLRIAAGSCEEMLFNLSFLADAQLISGTEFETFHTAYVALGKGIKQLIRHTSKLVN